MPEQKERNLQFKSPLGDKRCSISALSGRECLNDLYAFEITLVADQDPVVPDELLGEPVTVTINYAQVTRHIHGVVSEFVEVDPYGDNTFEYQVVVVPRLWLLGLSAHNRLFADKDAVDIVKEVVSSGCEMAVETTNLKTYRKREICCQYGETDLAFVTRLLAEEGIGYYFKHSDGDCKLVLSGGMDGFQKCSPASYPYNERDTSPWKQRVSRFRQAGRLCTGKIVSKDYNEYSPAEPLVMEARSRVSPKRLRPGEREEFGRHKFEWLGSSRNLPKGGCTEQSKRWLDGLESEGAEFNGISGAASFTAGHRFQLEDKPVSSGGETEFLLVEVLHNASEGYDKESVYTNSFRCVASSNAMAFTPAPPAEAPRIWGAHTAKVAEVYNPETEGAHGAVKVLFPWDTEQTACWSRVAQLYAGNKWGSYFVPDVGQEVVVEYLNGDPDRPLIVGAVYNEDNPIPPYTKWQSGIKTRSSDYNELRFDDNPGAEEVYFQAGKDHNFLIQNDETGEVVNNQALKVGVDQKIEIGQSQVLEVGTDQQQKINANQTVDVAANVEYSAGQKLEISAGTEIELTAGMSITLKVGATRVKLDNTGVTIEGTMIKVKGNAMTEVSSAAMLSLKGALMKIN